jgi:rod shape determining protein RodA
MNKRNNIWQHIDWITIAIFLFLTLFGWLNIYGAEHTFEQTSLFSLSNRAGKQFLWIGISVVIGCIILLIDERTYDILGYWLYGMMMVLLFITPILADNVKGSYSWISFGPISLQPAEFAKCFTAIAIAKYMGRYEYKLRNMKDLFIPFVLILLPTFIIMVLQRETGSALVFLSFLIPFYRQGMSGVIFIIGLVSIVLFIIVIKFSILPAIILLSVALLIGLVLIWKHKKIYRLWVAGIYICLVLYSSACNYAFTKILQPHQRTRIEVLLGMKDDPMGAGYNVNQARIAIGSGRFWGKGFLQGTQTKLKFVPEQDTDFIFCTVGEEWGFFGSSIVLLIYLYFILHLLTIAERQRDTFSRIFGYSVVGIFFFHLTINIGMVLGLLPVIGIPLPFFSYGGSSLMAFTILLFILIRLDAARINKLH